MRIAVFSTFPPTVCGIGDYAGQQADLLERQGNAVDRIDLEALRQGGWTRAAVAGVSQRMAAAEKVVVHYQVWLLRDRTKPLPWSHLKPRLALLRLLEAHGGKTEVVVHDGKSWTANVLKGAQVALARRTFAHAAALVVHTPQERDAFVQRYGLADRVQVRAHEADFVPRTDLDKLGARKRLGLDPRARVFLCIGFYTRGKGFEAFARQFHAAARKGELGPRDELHVVASVRERDDRVGQAALEGFVREFAGNGRVHLHPRYASPEEFDAWIVASDWVVLPYPPGYAASSGVAARAALLGRPLLATAAGGLAGQARPGDIVVPDAASLGPALRSIASQMA